MFSAVVQSVGVINPTLPLGGSAEASPAVGSQLPQLCTQDYYYNTVALQTHQDQRPTEETPESELLKAVRHKCTCLLQYM